MATPQVIADSDDEGDFGSSPPPPAWSPITNRGEPVASENISYAPDSASTDPSQFKRVLEEQLEAVRRQTQAAEAAKWRQDTLYDPYHVPSSPPCQGELLQQQKEKNDGCNASSKRRKLDNDSLDSLQRWGNDEDVDLVAMPLNYENGHHITYTPAPSDMLPPTLPPEAMASLTPGTKAFMYHDHRSQRQNVTTMRSSGLQSVDQGPSKTGYIVRSSGSATVINTQRGEDSLALIDYNAREVISHVEEARQFFHSSLDECAIIEPIPSVAQSIGNATKKKKKLKESIRGLGKEYEVPDELEPQLSPGNFRNASTGNNKRSQEPEPEPEPKVQEPVIIVDDDGSDFSQGLVKSKKGRQKKKPGNKAVKTDKADQAAPSDSTGGVGPKKSKKKKRGHPRNAEQQVVSHTDDYKSLQEVRDSTDTKGTEDGTASNLLYKEEDQSGKQKSNKSEEENQGTSENQKDDDKFPIQPAGDGDTASTTVAATIKADEKESKKDETQPLKRAAGSVSGASANANRPPIYRVGLSKRSKIAPLLKVIRK